MSVLPQARIDNIADDVFNSIGYSNDVRRNLISTQNRNFLGLFSIINVERLQLEDDLEKLNRYRNLTDGTAPLQLWLQRAARLMNSFPQIKTIQDALVDIGAQNGLVKPVNPAPPEPAVVTKIKESIVLRDEMLPFSFLLGGIRTGNAVVKVLIPRFENAQQKLLSDNSPWLYYGTGWLIGPDLIITNYHVINARDENEPNTAFPDLEIQCQHATIQFDYNNAISVGTTSSIAALEAFDTELDYAIIRTSTSPNREFLPIQNQRIQVNANNPQAVNIIQHPFGLAKKVAIRENHIFDAHYPLVTYFTDTNGGSSGACVADDNWKVIALHRASVRVNNVNYNGQTTAWVNEGVQIEAILRHLQIHFPIVFNRIPQS